MADRLAVLTEAVSIFLIREFAHRLTPDRRPEAVFGDNCGKSVVRDVSRHL
jgi:hypothetical protein